ncbi:MAG: DNA gyrase inhibitor YacG [Lautropia sp.]|nr:DNA gyrase inhibitor YacG [Lautropia sp.]
MVTCPGCGEVSPYSPVNRWRPFCSERCKMIDLGTWASDGYVVAGETLEADDDLIDPETGKARGIAGPGTGN